jgi:hypothetical protein
MEVDNFASADHGETMPVTKPQSFPCEGDNLLENSLTHKNNQGDFVVLNFGDF